jgi:hypothetical protein
MNAQDICDALRRYLSESEDDRREIATKIGIPRITLSAWLAGEAEPPKAFWHGWRVALNVPDTSNVFRTNPGFESVPPIPQK